MMSANKFGYTLVQHSGYGYAEKPGFAKGLEVRSLSTRAEANLVARVNGMIFMDYADAEDAAMELMYPLDYNGIYPAFKGTFSDKKIDGLAIAIPLRQVVSSQNT